MNKNCSSSLLGKSWLQSDATTVMLLATKEMHLNTWKLEGATIPFFWNAVQMLEIFPENKGALPFLMRIFLQHNALRLTLLHNAQKNKPTLFVWN